MYGDVPLTDIQRPGFDNYKALTENQVNTNSDNKPCRRPHVVSFSRTHVFLNSNFTVNSEKAFTLTIIITKANKTLEGHKAQPCRKRPGRKTVIGPNPQWRIRMDEPKRYIPISHDVGSHI